MSRIISIIRSNLFNQALAQISGKGLMFIVYMLLARILGPECYGVFDYTLSLILIVGGIFFEMGLELILTRELSNGNHEIFSHALWLKTGGAFMGGLLIIIIGTILHLSFPLLFVLIGFVLFNSYTNLFLYIFRAKARMYGETITIIVQRSMLLIMLGIIYFQYSHLTGQSSLILCSVSFSCAAFIGLLTASLLCYWFFPGLFYPEMAQVNIAAVRKLLMESLPLIGVSIFWLAYYKIDIVLLGILSTKEQVGFYSAAYKIMEASFVLPMIVSTTVYPHLSRVWAAQRDFFQRDYKKIFFILVGCGAMMATLLALMSTPIIRVLFGHEFMASTGILVILAIALIAVYPGHLVTQALVIIGRQRSYLLISMLATILNIVLNFVFIPIWQAKGAALATIITEGLVTIIAASVIRKHLKG